jgi:hypothetical protein
VFFHKGHALQSAAASRSVLSFVTALPFPLGR